MFDREEQGDSECKICSKLIADHRTYCAVHYQEAIEKYQDDLQSYDRANAEWECLSEDEKKRRNEERDQQYIRTYAVGLILILTLTLCTLTEQNVQTTAIASFISVLVMWLTRPLYVIFGRIGRGLKRGLIYTIVIVSLLWIGLLFTQDFPYPHEALMGSGILCVIFGLWRESMGRYHVTAKPQPPVRPTP
jgi:hypothetical protein